MSVRKNSRRYFFVFFIAFPLVVSPLNFSFFIQTPIVEGESVPVEEIVGSVVWSESRVVAGMVSVRPGATLTIPRGVVIEFANQSGIDVLGTLNITGTPEQPVILKKKDGGNVGDYYAIKSISGGRTVARNVDISGGGGAYEAFQVMRPSWINRAYAYWFYVGALSAYNGGTLDIEGVSFHDNPLAVYTDSSSYSKTKVWRSKFSQNGLDVVNQHIQGKADVRYNWWGDATGPALCVTECADRPRAYEKMIGAVNFVDWATSLQFKDPVVVIPGIMGSWRVTQSSELELDPVFGTYDELVETLDENGYTPDQDLFLFPYEWRMSNVETAKSLKSKIDQIKTQTKWPRVDIVAHSMGGLVAREYIGALNGGSSIDQLITLGTPHNGSPKSYLTWDGGKFSSVSRFSLADFFTEKVFQQEAEENGYESTFDYVRSAPIASVRELLSVNSYLREKDTREMRVYPELYPRNTFIEKLNTPAYLNKLTPILFSNIIGKTSSDETISMFRVEGASIELLNDPESKVLWGHGKPDGYDNILGGDRGMELGQGDGTVPLESATGITADETIELESNHGNLPADGAKTVVRILTGRDAIVSGPIIYPAQSILIFMPFSPIDIQIVSPSGNKVGKNFETGGYYNEIPGAYYTGYDTQNEFIAIPHPEKGEYRVLTQGTGDGTYRVEAVHIEENPDGQTEESTAVIAGVAEFDLETESAVELKETGEVALGGQDMLAPVSTVAVSGTGGANNWYTSDVSVTLTATDEEGGSGVAKTEYSLDGTNWQEYGGPFSVTTEGVTVLQYFSTDTAGNKEEVKTETIKIDRVAPEGKITFNTTTQKLDIIGIDNLGKNVAVTVTELPIVFVGPRLRDHHDRSHEEHRGKKRFQAQLTDEAGHVTDIVFSRETQERNELAVKLLSVAYDDVPTRIMGTEAQYEWQINRFKKYQKFEAELKTATHRLESRYMPKKNETWIREQRKDDDEDEKKHGHDPEWQKLPGLVVPYLMTTHGEAEVKYE